MWPYWVLLLIPALLALQQKAEYAKLPKNWPSIWWFWFFILTMMIGLRDEVGGDWGNYIVHLENASNEAIFETMFRSDPAYKLLNWVSSRIGGGIYFVNTVGAALFSWGLITFCRKLPRPWLAMTAAIPYLVIVVAMGYTRQGISIGLTMLALAALMEKRLYAYFIFITIAALFHKSAIIVLPFVAFSSASNRWWRLALMLTIIIVLYVLLIRDAQDYIVAGYITAEYNSQGAVIRVIMNAVPAAIFLLFEQRFKLNSDQRSFWRLMSVSALIFIPLLIISPSSTAVDRVALYWIPLQLFVFSLLPNALGVPRGKNFPFVATIIGYYICVQGVWLLFAIHAGGWLPYRFYPWIWLWDLPSKFQFIT